MSALYLYEHYIILSLPPYSEEAIYNNKKAIRGGIPVVFRKSLIHFPTKHSLCSL